METSPLVSVILATYNEKPDYIERSIQSILNQEYDNIELIVLDDSDNKETIRTIDRLSEQDGRIKVVRKAARMGFVPSLNEGLRLARGEYIARMDGDDIALPNRLSDQISYLTAHPDVDVLGGAMNVINEAGEKISQRVYPARGWRMKLYTIFRSPLGHPTVIFRRERLGDFNYDETFKKAEDIELWLRLRNEGVVFDNIKSLVLNYRVSGDMATKRNHSQFKALLRARIKNFNWRYWYFDLPSIVVAALYSIAPLSLMGYFYNRNTVTESR